MTEETVIYAARRIHTMNPSLPTASHVAVRGGRILGVGSIETLAGWGPYRVDSRLADKILLPGFVEGHSHAMEGAVWAHTYVGFHDRRGPDGVVRSGLTSIEAVVERLRTAATDGDEPLLAWGFDPIYFKSRRMVAADLDAVSTERPVLVMHASYHIMNVNSKLMELAGVKAGANIEGIIEDDAGEPTGELRGPAGRYLVLRVAGEALWSSEPGATELDRFARSAQLAGVTTATDLHAALPPQTVATLRACTARPDFPLRIVPALAGNAQPAEEGVKRLGELRGEAQERLRFGLVKLVADGSIQGFSARLRWPGYYNGAPNGMWYIAPSDLRRLVSVYHAGGARIHIHTNGDEATQVAIDAIEAALTEVPRPDHRHTLQHCQMASAAQYARMGRLGICANVFSNHLYYWGDAHYEQTMGPERACRLDAAATAIRAGVRIAMHSDAPITPIGPLFTAWCAVNRVSLAGRVLGAAERISVAQALEAITVGAAYTLGLDDEIGSIEVGKQADFAVLEADPFETPSADLKDIAVWGTVLGGTVFPA